MLTFGSNSSLIPSPVTLPLISLSFSSQLYQKKKNFFKEKMEHIRNTQIPIWELL